MVEEKPVVEQVVSVKGKQKPKPKLERSPGEANGVLWLVVDEAQSSMHDPLTTSEEKRHWAKVLTDAVC